MTVPKIAQMFFPEVAQIRKGMPKVKKVGQNGKECFVVGPDLKDKFRVSFAPGTDDAKAAYAALHEKEYTVFGDGYAERDGFLVSRIRAMMPFSNVSMAWEWSNEAHNAGRMIAKADDTHFLILRDPTNGKYIVENGEPYTEFKHGQTVNYEKDGKQFVLPIKTSCRLRLFLPELERFVTFTLKSTSFYDRVNIDAQLQSIQMIANMFSNGNAAGVPFYIYRREQEITWNKPDGSAARIKKWLINVEADSEWVKAATRRMANFALTGEVVTKALLPIVENPAPITGMYNPDEPDLGDGDIPGGPTDEIIDGEADDMPLHVYGVSPAPVAAPEPAPAPTIPEPREATIKIGNKMLKDHTVDELRAIIDNPKSTGGLKALAEKVLSWKLAQ